VETRTQGDDGSPFQLIRYQLGNHLGSASLELDAVGAIVSYEEYLPYGGTSYQAVDAKIRAAAKRYRYTGMERDEETGLAYHGARYYACWLGRWCSTDPVPLDNRYLYATNRPLIFFDPNGEIGFLAPLMVLGLIVGGVMTSSNAHAPTSEQQASTIEPEGFIEGNARLVSNMATGAAIGSGVAALPNLVKSAPSALAQLGTREGIQTVAAGAKDVVVDEARDYAIETGLNSVAPGSGTFATSVGVGGALRSRQPLAKVDVDTRGSSVASQVDPDYGAVSARGWREKANYQPPEHVFGVLSESKRIPSAFSPLMYGLPRSGSTGRIWVSDAPITSRDVDALISGDLSGREVIVLSGTHGEVSGQLGPADRDFYRQDISSEGAAVIRGVRTPGSATVIDVGGMTDDQLAYLVQRYHDVDLVIGSCYSSCSTPVIQGLVAPPLPNLSSVGAGRLP
jgi:RHS repeat-associated protein